MKTLIKKTLFIVLMTVTMNPVSFASSITNEKIGVTNELNPEEQRLVNRLEEIKSVNTKLLSRKERKELRHEKIMVQEEIGRRRGGGGIYISVGAIIIILLLIIILH